MKIIVVIPTKNRPDDLFSAVSSIVLQSRLPDELCIVDQSSDMRSKFKVKDALKECGIAVRYIYDPSILGLVDAKRVSVEEITGDLICFLEDDIVLEKEYLSEIEKGFVANESMMGCSGIVTNPPVYTSLRLRIFKMFHRGIFYDKRVEVYGNFSGLGHSLVPSRMISGGMSAWKSEVFQKVKFDVENQFHMYEDIDFSLRVYDHYKGGLFINPNARLEHNFSPIDRSVYGDLQERKLRECVIFYKKNSKYRWSLFALLWLLLGLLLDATIQTIKFKKKSILMGYFLGVRKGVRGRIK